MSGSWEGETKAIRSMGNSKLFLLRQWSTSSAWFLPQRLRGSQRFLHGGDGFRGMIPGLDPWEITCNFRVNMGESTSKPSHPSIFFHAQRLKNRISQLKLHPELPGHQICSVSGLSDTSTRNPRNWQTVQTLMLRLIGSENLICATCEKLRGSDGREMPGRISGVDLSYKVSGNRLCFDDPNCFPEPMSRFCRDFFFTLKLFTRGHRGLLAG